MIYMDAAGDRGGWPRWTRRMAAVPDGPHTPAVAGAVLALAAMTEAIARGAATGVSAADLVGMGALAASTTVPLAFLGPLAAAVAICAASTLARGLRDAHGRGPGRDAYRPVPAGPERRITERPLADGELMGPGPVPGAAWPCRS